MNKILRFISILLFVFIFLSPKSALAADKFVTIINPVRGTDFWSLPGQSSLDFPNFQKNIHTGFDINSTWLLRPDFFLGPKSTPVYFQNPDFSQDELGIFLEVTPSWAEEAGVDYQNNRNWWFANRIFLSAYNPQERIKLLDHAFLKFKNTYGHFPQTVGAWHIDPESASYLKDKYQINSVLVCADQYGTDNYQIWGGWWGVPVYPQKTNLLLPANSSQNKLDVLLLWWAQRDPLNAYGFGVRESTYSVQANDYLLHKLDTSYFSTLSDFYLSPKAGEFGQLTIGLENDNPLKNHASEYQKQLRTLREKSVRFLTVSEFTTWYKKEFPDFSPPHQIGGADALGSNRAGWWEMDIQNRTFYTQNPGEEKVIQDQRSYRLSWPDPYLKAKNPGEKLFWNIPAHPVLPFSSPSFLIFPLLFISAFFVFKKLKIKTPVIIFIFTLALAFTLPMIRSGKLYDYGLAFWGPNGHDGVWHLSLIEQFKKTAWPPQNPVFALEPLNNYHWGFDLSSGLLLRLLPVSALNLYFRLLPLLFALSLGLASYLFAKSKTKSSRVGTYFVFLSFFAGSLGWIFTLLKDGQIGGESLFWSMQSISTLINPPYALSLPLFLLALHFWAKWRKKGKTQNALFLGLFFGLLTGIKVYAGILAGLGLSLFYLYKIIKKESKPFDFLVCLGTGLVSLILLFLMGVISSGSGLVFRPLWFVHSLIESLDKIYWPRLATLRHNLLSQLLTWKLPFFLAIEAFLVLLFLVGNFGFRLIGLFSHLLKKTRLRTNLDQLLFIIIGLGVLFPLLFVQQGTSWNTIQFMYYSLFFANYYLAVHLARLKPALAIFILLLAFPTTYSTLKNYLGNPAPASIPHYELEALDFLRHQEDGLVLTYPWDEFQRNKYDAPKPLRFYETSAYVSALSSKPAFLEDEMNLEITGYPWKERKELLIKFFEQKLDRYQARGLLVNNDITYLYLVTPHTLPYQPQDLGVDMIFTNGNATIYEIRK